MSTIPNENGFTEVVRAKVTPGVKQKLLRYATDNTMKQSEVVRQAVNEYLKKHEGCRDDAGGSAAARRKDQIDAGPTADEFRAAKEEKERRRGRKP